MMVREETVCFEDNLVEDVTISLIFSVDFDNLREMFFFSYKMALKQIYGFNMH